MIFTRPFIDRDSLAARADRCDAELHPPAGPADELYSGAAHERRAACLRRLRLTQSPSDDKPSQSPSDGGIGNSSVTAAVWLRMLAGMPPPKMLVT